MFLFFYLQINVYNIYDFTNKTHLNRKNVRSKKSFTRISIVLDFIYSFVDIKSCTRWGLNRI